MSHTWKEMQHVHVQCHKPARQLHLTASSVRDGSFGDHRRVVSRSDLAVVIVDDVLAGLHARAEVMGSEDDLDHNVRSCGSAYVYARWS